MDFGFERSEALTGRRRRLRRPRAGGGFESMDYSRCVPRIKQGHIPTPIAQIHPRGPLRRGRSRDSSHQVGKTAAFLIPVLHKLRALPESRGARRGLSPTPSSPSRRSSCAGSVQVHDLRAVCIVGGDSMEAQFRDLSTNPDLIVATPGRLLHHVEEIDGFSIAQSLTWCWTRPSSARDGLQAAPRYPQAVRGDSPDVALLRLMPSQLAGCPRRSRNPQVIRLDAEMKCARISNSRSHAEKRQKIPALLYILREVVPPKQQTVVFWPRGTDSSSPS